MSSLIKFTTLLIGGGLFALTLHAADDQLDAATKARVARFEKGAASINVSGYPAGIQANYETFSQKCSQCHKLSRPINSDYATPDEWHRYISRMMHKPGSGISGGDAKKIYDFLVFDSAVRKKAVLDEKLSKASPQEKADAEAKIKEVQAKYGK